MEDQLNAAYAVQNEKAIIIQQHWREYLARKAAGVEEATAQEDPVDTDANAEQQRLASLLERYSTLVEMQKELFKRNGTYQQMLHSRIDDVKDVARRVDPENPTEIEPRYAGSLARLVHKRISHDQLVEEREKHAHDIEERIAAHKASTDETLSKLFSFRRLLLAGPTDSSTRRRSAQHVALDAQDEGDKVRLQQLSEARVTFLKLRNKQRKLAKLLREKEKADTGLHLIDFEQLKIENQSWNEKIEERNEDLLKMRKKATSTIHILTHVKEKLVYTLTENAALREHLDSVDAELASARDALAKRKKKRDGLVVSNIKMKERTPLVSAHDLLVDYEQRKAIVVSLRDQVARLRAHHHALAQYIASYQKLFSRASNAAAASMPALSVGA